MLRSLLPLALAALAGCNDGRATGGPPDRVVGEWLASHPAPDGARTETRMAFGADGGFRSEVRWYGFHGHPPATLTGYARETGEFRLQGDRLMLRIRRTENWQMYAAGPNPAVEERERSAWTGQGTLRVEGDRLLLTTTSAPADAPVTDTTAYARVR